MILETISIDENTKIYKGKLGLFEKYNNKELIKKIEYLKHLYPEFVSNPQLKYPGYQFPILTIFDEIIFMQSQTKEWARKNFKIGADCMVKAWVYISDKNNPHSGYHSHKKTQYEYNGKIKEFDSSFTTTYYLQIPNNLEGDDGYLYFKTKDEKEYGILPKEDEIIIFPADLEHNVKCNRKSTIPRICIASNYMFFDYKDAKLEKTIL